MSNRVGVQTALKFWSTAARKLLESTPLKRGFTHSAHVTVKRSQLLGRTDCPTNVENFPWELQSPRLTSLGWLTQTAILEESVLCSQEFSWSWDSSVQGEESGFCTQSTRDWLLGPPAGGLVFGGSHLTSLAFLSFPNLQTSDNNTYLVR